MKRTDIIALLIVFGVVFVAVIGIVATSLSFDSNIAGQAMYAKGYQSGYQKARSSLPPDIRSGVSENCTCPQEVDQEKGFISTMIRGDAAPFIAPSCSENDESLGGSSAIRHNNPNVKETLTIRQSSTVLQTKEDSCVGDELIQWECNPEDQRNPRQLRQRCDIECRSGRCASYEKPAGSCREFEHGVYGFIGGSGFGRTTGYLTDSCANRKVLIDVYCIDSFISPIQENDVVCDGACESSPMQLPNGEWHTYGRCV